MLQVVRKKLYGIVCVLFVTCHTLFQ